MLLKFKSKKRGNSTDLFILFNKESTFAIKKKFGNVLWTIGLNAQLLSDERRFTAGVWEWNLGLTVRLSFSGETETKERKKERFLFP